MFKLFDSAGPGSPRLHAFAKVLALDRPLVKAVDTSMDKVEEPVANMPELTVPQATTTMCGTRVLDNGHNDTF